MRTYNIKDTYIDKYYPWLGILVAESFKICSTENRLKGYSPGQILFGNDIILQIKHTVGWKLILQRKQAQMNKDIIFKNGKIVDHHYTVGDKVILNHNSAFKYETTYKYPF